MAAIDGVPLLLTAAEALARLVDQQNVEIIESMSKQGGRTVFVNGLRVGTVEIEIAAVGVFSLFEARLQHHFPPGSFFRQLREHLIEANQIDLANRVHCYYLAINALKHGHGASYKELRTLSDLPFAIKQPGDLSFDEGDVTEPEGLVDIRSGNFFPGLVDTLRSVSEFLAHMDASISDD